MARKTFFEGVLLEENMVKKCRKTIFYNMGELEGMYQPYLVTVCRRLQMPTISGAQDIH